MKKTILVLAALGFSQAALAQWRVEAERTVGGFAFPESVAYDPAGKALYVGNFGGQKLAPGEKDGQGYISKLSLDGKVIEQRWAPAAGTTMNKPKGIWIRGNRLWVTDIDAVWIFDLKSKKNRRLELPGVGFANDPAVMGNVLYISDNRNDKLVRVTPADFLNAKDVSVSEVIAGQGINPNGIYPTKIGMLLFAGFEAPNKPKAIHALGVSGQVKALSAPIGRIDGLYEIADGEILYTDWNTGSLSLWSEKHGITHLLTRFKGPADFAVIPKGRNAMTVVVPDLVQSELRFVELRRQ